MQSGRRFLPDLNQIWISSANFYGSRHTKFYGNLSSDNCGDKTRKGGLKKERINTKRKKRTDLTNATGDFWDCVNAPNCNQLNYC